MWFHFSWFAGRTVWTVRDAKSVMKGGGGRCLFLESIIAFIVKE